MEPLTIGQVARLAEVGVETVRFYERRGLIEEPRVSGCRHVDERRREPLRRRQRHFRVQAIGPGGRPRLVSRADERWWVTTRRVYSPTDVAVDPSGSLYVVDFAASKIQQFRAILR